jgi:hypothetical protein
MKYLVPICDLDAHPRTALCLSYALENKEHAVRSRRNRRAGKSEMRSLVERLKALEHTDLPSPIVTANSTISTSIPFNSSRSLIRWFGVGFACACIAGGIALLAEMTDIEATEATPAATALDLSRP